MKEVCGDYLERVLQLLSSCSADVLDAVKQSILQGGRSLKHLVPLVINTIVEALVEKSVEVSFIICQWYCLIWPWKVMRVLLFIYCFKYFLDCDRLDLLANWAIGNLKYLTTYVSILSFIFPFIFSKCLWVMNLFSFFIVFLKNKCRTWDSWRE